MTKKVLITAPLTREMARRIEQAAEGGNFDVTFEYLPNKRVLTDEVIASGLQERTIPAEESEENPGDALSGFAATLGDTPLSIVRHNKETLEWLQMNSVGFDDYVRGGMLSDACVLCNAAGMYGTIVSEHMIGLTFDILRGFGYCYEGKAQHLWRPSRQIQVVEGSTVVVLGLGDIGGRYAEKMKALGAYVIGVRRKRTEKPSYLNEQITFDELDDVLPRADILAMVIPGGLSTYHLMDERRLKLMKRGSVIVNAGRGTSIDQKALVKLLNEDYFLGAGLDVTDPEPLPADDPLWDAKNLLLCPHTAGTWHRETMNKFTDICVENMKAWVHGGEFSRVISLEERRSVAGN